MLSHGRVVRMRNIPVVDGLRARDGLDRTIPDLVKHDNAVVEDKAVPEDSAKR